MYQVISEKLTVKTLKFYSIKYFCQSRLQYHKYYCFSNSSIFCFASDTNGLPG
jgi:hypothetical protein